MRRGTFEFLNFIGTPLAEPTGFHKLLYNQLPHLPCGGNDTYFCGDFLESLFVTSILSLWKISIVGQAGLSRPHSWTPESGYPSLFLICARAGGHLWASTPPSLTAYTDRWHSRIWGQAKPGNLASPAFLHKANYRNFWFTLGLLLVIIKL